MYIIQNVWYIIFDIIKLNEVYWLIEKYVII